MTAPYSVAVMSSYDSITRKPVSVFVRLVGVAVIATMLMGVSRSAAQDDAPEVSLATTTSGSSAADERIASLEHQLAEQDLQIAALQEQLAIARQAALEDEQRIENQRNTILTIQQLDSGDGDVVDEAYARWVVGYRLAGGTNVAAFENVILPCESGGEPDPDVAIGPTDDWGRAQINRPTWKGRFEQIMGVEFETFILNPTINGFMAAIVEQEHPRGLNAWTCWRRR